MKQHLSLAASALALALLLSACGGGSGGDGGGASAPGGWNEAGSSESVGAAPEDFGFSVSDYDAPQEAPETNGSGGTGSSSLGPNSADVKLIYRGSLYVETLDFDQAAAALDSLVASLGGYFESSSLYQGGYYSSGIKSASYIIRVPSEQFKVFLSQVGETDNCRVVRQEQSADDVGTAYHDAEARLQTLRIQQERLQTLLSQAETMVDIIDLENALSNVEYEIEQYTSTLNRYDSLVGFATIELSLEQVDRLSDAPAEQKSLGQRMGRGFQSAVERFGMSLTELAVWFSYNFIVVLIFLALAAAVGTVLVRSRKRRRAARAAAIHPSWASQPPAEEKPEQQPKQPPEPPSDTK